MEGKAPARTNRTWTTLKHRIWPDFRNSPAQAVSGSSSFRERHFLSLLAGGTPRGSFLLLLRFQSTLRMRPIGRISAAISVKRIGLGIRRKALWDRSISGSLAL